MVKVRLTETQRLVLRCHVDGMIVTRRRDTMIKLVALGLATMDPATMTERLKVGCLTAEGRRVAAVAAEDPDRATFEIAPLFARIRIQPARFGCDGDAPPAKEVELHAESRPPSPRRPRPTRPLSS